MCTSCVVGCAQEFRNPLDPSTPSGTLFSALLLPGAGAPTMGCALPPDGQVDAATSLYYGTMLLDREGCLVVMLTETNGSTYANYRAYRYSEGSWQSSAIAAGRHGFKDSALFDSAGTLHAALVNYPSPNQAYYATNGNSYSEQIIPGIAPDTAYFGIGLDGAGKAHVTSLLYATRNRYYSTNASGTWVNSTISTDSLASATLAVDSAFPPSIVYYRWSTRDVMSADASNWGAPTLLEDYGVDNGPSPVMKVHNGKRYVAYAYSNDGGYLNGYLVVNDDSTGAWVKTYLESNTTRPIGVDLVLDAAGKQHVVACNRLGDMRYYSNKSGSWQSSLVGPGACLMGTAIETILSDDRLLVLHQGPDNRQYVRSFRPSDYP